MRPLPARGLRSSVAPCTVPSMETWRQFWQAVEAVPPLSVPLWQILLFVVAVSLASLWERYRLILLLAYLFSFHWVFIENLRLLALNRPRPDPAPARPPDQTPPRQAGRAGWRGASSPAWTCGPTITVTWW